MNVEPDNRLLSFSSRAISMISTAATERSSKCWIGTRFSVSTRVANMIAPSLDASSLGKWTWTLCASWSMRPMDFPVPNRLSSEILVEESMMNKTSMD